MFNSHIIPLYAMTLTQFSEFLFLRRTNGRPSRAVKRKISVYYYYFISFFYSWHLTPDLLLRLNLFYCPIKALISTKNFFPSAAIANHVGLHNNGARVKEDFRFNFDRWKFGNFCDLQKAWV